MDTSPTPGSNPETTTPPNTDRELLIWAEAGDGSVEPAGRTRLLLRVRVKTVAPSGSRVQEIPGVRPGRLKYLAREFDQSIVAD